MMTFRHDYSFYVVMKLVTHIWIHFERYLNVSGVMSQVTVTNNYFHLVGPFLVYVVTLVGHLGRDGDLDY
jgi:hypothetical protein